MKSFISKRRYDTPGVSGDGLFGAALIAAAMIVVLAALAWCAAFPTVANGEEPAAPVSSEQFVENAAGRWRVKFTVLGEFHVVTEVERLDAPTPCEPFDADCNGVLDDCELVARYDLDGDGRVTLYEFAVLQRLMDGGDVQDPQEPPQPPEPPEPPQPPPAGDDDPPAEQAGHIEPIADWAVYPYELLQRGERVGVVADSVPGIWGVQFSVGDLTATVRERSIDPRTGLRGWWWVIPDTAPVGGQEFIARVVGKKGGVRTVRQTLRIESGALPADLHLIEGKTFKRPDKPPAGTVIYLRCTWEGASTGYNAASDVYYADCVVRNSPGMGFRDAWCRNDRVEGCGNDGWQNCRTMLGCVGRDLVAVIRGMNPDGSPAYEHGDWWQWYCRPPCMMGLRILSQCRFTNSDYQYGHCTKGATIEGMLIEDVDISGPDSGGKRNDGRIVALMEADIGQLVVNGLTSSAPVFFNGQVARSRLSGVSVSEWKGPEG
jgi:hypothetical protein